MKRLAPLDRLFELDEVAAAFLYSGENRVEAAAAPEHYQRETLQALVTRIEQVVQLIKKAKIGFRETRFDYEGHTIWLKSIGADEMLVVFVLPSSDMHLLRQPINLAAVNLEKAFLRLPEDVASDVDTDLVTAAHRAEMELLQEEVSFVEEPNYQRLAALTGIYVGPIGSQVLEYSLRELKIRLPYSSTKEMQSSVEYAANLIQNVERQKQYLDAANDLIERLGNTIESNSEN
jgi:hypothetical protein